MKYEEISPVMRQFIGGWEAFRQLGFKSDDLFLQTSMSAGTRKMSAFVVLKAQDKQFTLEIGPIPCTEESFCEEYQKVSVAISSGAVSQEDLNKIWQESLPYHMQQEFIGAVLMKGFAPPAMSMGTMVGQETCPVCVSPCTHTKKATKPKAKPKKARKPPRSWRK